MIKRLFGGLIATAAFASLFAAAPAAAAGYYVYPSLTNGDTLPLTVTNVTWSGSYNPQIAATIQPGVGSPGRLKTVFDTGYSELGVST